MEPTQQPLFTITIPTLGKVDIWMDAIHSVIAQTYSHWEVIAIDSGDEAKSRPLIEALGDKRIIYVNTSKGNPRLNWDTGYRHATGEYLLWLDDDNYLLPNALQTLADTIENKGHPDVVTAEHMHYRGLEHYIESYKNQLVIPLPLFAGNVTKIDQTDIVRRLMGWPQRAPNRARFHTSENAVRRNVIDALVAKIGKIDFETTSTHTLRLGMVAIAKDVYVIDTPIALIGQSGKAMTDTWPRIDSPVLKEVVYTFSLSPLHANTYANYRLENMLQSQALLKEYLGDIGINLSKFIEAYRRELIAFPQTWGAWFRNWKELSKFVSSHQEQEFAHLRRTMPKFYGIAVCVQIIRTLGAYGLLQKVFAYKRVSHNPNAKIIPLTPYGVTSIRSCAEKLPEVVEKELGLSYATFIASQQ